MPYIAVLLIILAAFGVGRCTAPEPVDKGYQVIEVEKEVVKREVIAGAMPDSCRTAAALLPRLVADLEGIDVAVGDLDQLAFELATFTEQPGGQIELNKRLMQANQLQTEIASISMPALETSQEYTRLAAACDRDLTIE